MLLKGERLHWVPFSSLHQKPDVCGRAFHHSISNHYVADIQPLTWCQSLLQRLRHSAFSSLAVINSEEELPCLRGFDDIKIGTIEALDETEDILAIVDGNVSHKAMSTLKERVTRPKGYFPHKLYENHQWFLEEIECGDTPNLSRARGGKGGSMFTSYKFIGF